MNLDLLRGSRVLVHKFIHDEESGGTSLKRVVDYEAYFAAFGQNYVEDEFGTFQCSVAVVINDDGQVMLAASELIKFVELKLKPKGMHL